MQALQVVAVQLFKKGGVGFASFMQFATGSISVRKRLGMLRFLQNTGMYAKNSAKNATPQSVFYPFELFSMVFMVQLLSMQKISSKVAPIYIDIGQ